MIIGEPTLPEQYRLRWDPNYPGLPNCETAFLGAVDIASIVKMSDGSGWKYNIRGIHTKWIAKGSGKVSTRAAARRAVNRGWKRWLEAAGLI